MNRQIARIGAGIVCATVFLFALFLIVDFKFGYFLVCMFLVAEAASDAARRVFHRLLRHADDRRVQFDGRRAERLRRGDRAGRLVRVFPARGRVGLQAFQMTSTEGDT